MPFGETKADSPEQLKRQRRGNLYARFVFIIIALFLVVHRIVIIALAGAMFNYAANGPASGAAGMLAVFGDPLGTLAFLALAKVVPESALYPVYVAATILINSLIIYFFWRALRYAFIKKQHLV